MCGYSVNTCCKFAEAANVCLMTDTPKPDESPKPQTTPEPPKLPPEIGGTKGPEPTRYGDWAHKGRVSDF